MGCRIAYRGGRSDSHRRGSCSNCGLCPAPRLHVRQRNPRLGSGRTSDPARSGRLSSRGGLVQMAINAHVPRIPSAAPRRIRPNRVLPCRVNTQTVFPGGPPAAAHRVAPAGVASRFTRQAVTRSDRQFPGCLGSRRNNSSSKFSMIELQNWLTMTRSPLSTRTVWKSRLRLIVAGFFAYLRPLCFDEARP